jgi:hypothetical protein
MHCDLDRILRYPALQHGVWCGGNMRDDKRALQFRNNATTTELMGVRDTPMGTSLYRARPIRVEAGCLECHGPPALAPATLIARYGHDNGFGWLSHEVIGAQVVSVPLAGAMQSRECAFELVSHLEDQNIRSARCRR